MHPYSAPNTPVSPSPHSCPPTRHSLPVADQHLIRLITTAIVAVAAGTTAGLLFFIVGWFYAALAAHHTLNPDGHGAQIVALATLFGSVGTLATTLVTAAITYRTTRRDRTA